MLQKLLNLICLVYIYIPIVEQFENKLKIVVLVRQLIL